MLKSVGHQPLTGSVSVVNPQHLTRPDVLWASPPCQAYSIARNKNLAERDDADIGLAIIPFLEILQPPKFILENVEGYRKSKVFEAIVNALYRLGYWVNWSVLNAADFAVPQTRRRLILRAVKNGFVPPLPPLQKWCGWYEALAKLNEVIADLIPSLSPTQLAPWQLKRLSPELIDCFLIDSKNASGAVAKNIGKAHTKQTIHYAPQISQEALPIFSWQYSFPNGKPTVRFKSEPIFTINSAINKGLPLECGAKKYGQPSTQQTISLHTTNQQNKVARIFQAKPPKAVLIERHGARSNRSLTLRTSSRCAWTIRASVTTDGKDGNRKAFVNALVEGQVLNLNIHAIARLQTFPDWYTFPESTALAGRIIGNAVPPLMVKSLILNTIVS